MQILRKAVEVLKRVGNANRRKPAAKHEASARGENLKEKASSKLKDKATNQVKSGGTVTGGTNLNAGKASGPLQVAGGKLQAAGKK